MRDDLTPVTQQQVPEQPTSRGGTGGLMMWVVFDRIPPYPSNHQAREFEITAAGPRETGTHAVGSLEQCATTWPGIWGWSGWTERPATTRPS